MQNLKNNSSEFYSGLYLKKYILAKQSLFQKSKVGSILTITYTIKLADAEKVLYKLQHPFIIKILSKVGIRGNVLKVIKGTHEINITHKVKRQNVFLLSLGEKDFTINPH